MAGGSITDKGVAAFRKIERLHLTKKAALLGFWTALYLIQRAAVGEKKPGLAGLHSYSKDFFLLSLYIPFVLLSSTEH